VERKLIKVISYGKENITALGDDELAHSKNRRALIILDQR
jgi:outer membrane protein OmpA-like peptidoglycan-associated protein